MPDRRHPTFVALILAACSAPGLPGPTRTVARPLGARPVLVLMPNSPSAELALEGIRREVADQFELLPRYVSPSNGPDDVARAIDEVAPAAVVLMNNPTLRLYRRYQEALPEPRRPPPAVGLLIAFMEESSFGVINLVGVRYEVPLITSLVNLRDILDQPLERVGVVHREGFEDFIDKQRSLLDAEGFVLVSRRVEGRSVAELRAALDELVSTERVDALWALNDNVLLEDRMVERAWLTVLLRESTPVVVNVESLMSRRRKFGTFGVLPDHFAMGEQAGALLLSVVEQGIASVDAGFEYPISVRKILDLRLAKSRIALRPSSLDTLDRVID